jgi:hypothetical protein
MATTPLPPPPAARPPAPAAGHDDPDDPAERRHLLLARVGGPPDGLTAAADQRSHRLESEQLIRSSDDECIRLLVLEAPDTRGLENRSSPPPPRAPGRRGSTGVRGRWDPTSGRVRPSSQQCADRVPVRYRLALLMGLGYMLCYAQRLTMPIGVISMAAELGWSKRLQGEVYVVGSCFAQVVVDNFAHVTIQPLYTTRSIKIFGGAASAVTMRPKPTRRCSVRFSSDTPAACPSPGSSPPASAPGPPRASACWYPRVWCA